MAKNTGGKGKKAAPSTSKSKPSAAKAKKPAAEKSGAPAKPAAAKKPTPAKKSPGAKAPKATPAVTTKTKGKEAKSSASKPPKPATKSAKKPAKAEAAVEAKKDKKGAAKAIEAKPEKAPKPSGKSKATAGAKPSKPDKPSPKGDDKSSKKSSAKSEAKTTVSALERYSIQSKESMDASRAAAARFAKAAGLQPVQSSMNGDIDETPVARLTKSPFSKKQLTHFREVLMLKRRQLVGDVTSMESEALTGGSGSLSHLPQHMADQGSDTYDQTLALDLAASQRGMLKEIDDALARIDAGTYGICDMLGVAISPERLEETPWARYSIDAARRLERGAYAR